MAGGSGSREPTSCTASAEVTCATEDALRRPGFPGLGTKKVLLLSGVPETKLQAEFTMITKDDAPYEVERHTK